MSTGTPICSSEYSHGSTKCPCYFSPRCQTTTTVSVIPHDHSRLREVMLENIKKIEELETLQEVVTRARERERQARKREKARKESDRAKIATVSDDLQKVEKYVQQKQEEFDTYSLALQKCETAKLTTQEIVNKLLRQNETLSSEVQKLQKTLDRKNKATLCIQSEILDFRRRLEEVRKEEKENNIEASKLNKKTLQLIDAKDKLEFENKRKVRELADLKKKPLEHIQEIQEQIDKLRSDNMCMTKVLISKKIPRHCISEADVGTLSTNTPTTYFSVIPSKVTDGSSCTCGNSQQYNTTEGSIKYDDMIESIRETAAKASAQLNTCQC